MYIDYALLLKDNVKSNSLENYNILCNILIDKWCTIYREMSGTKTNILQFSQHDFHFLFDYPSEYVERGKLQYKDVTDDRVVVVFGKSVPTNVKRDTTRMKGFLGGPLMDDQGNQSDKGHFMGHSLGGGMDVNLFPQNPEINRGYSERGKVFRQMEKYCAKNAGTFCFSRPIYNTMTWKPALIEYGILMPDQTFWVEMFEND